MTYQELQSWRAQHELSDEWWVASAQQTLPTPVSLGEALEFKCAEPAAAIYVMHVRLTESNPVWSELVLDPAISRRTATPFPAAVTEPVSAVACA